jgi:hemerythrin superfamily protein
MGIASTIGSAPKPLDMLRMEHEFVRQLFMRFLSTDDIEVRQEIGPRLLAMLEMHSALEETIFYPAVRELAPSLIAQCMTDHAWTDQLLRELKATNFIDATCDHLMQQLHDAIMHHVDMEETHLFPVVREACPDLDAIGLEMQAFESMALDLQPRDAGERGGRGSRRH